MRVYSSGGDIWEAVYSCGGDMWETVYSSGGDMWETVYSSGGGYVGEMQSTIKPVIYDHPFWTQKSGLI